MIYVARDKHYGFLQHHASNARTEDHHCVHGCVKYRMGRRDLR